MACDEREFLGDVMTAEDEADENIAWLMDYINGYGQISWSMLGHKIDKGDYAFSHGYVFVK